MATLLVTVLAGLVIAFFATQNTGIITLFFLEYKLVNIPIYIVIVGALLVGLFLGWILSLINGIATGFTIWGKESRIKDYKKENADLLKEKHQLELENTRLKAQTNEPADDKSL